MNSQASVGALPFGLLELDSAGVVVRYSPAFEQNPKVKQGDVLGRNFFTEVLPAPEVKEHQDRFRFFMAEGQTRDQFSTTFQSEGGQIKVQILLALITERSEHGNERLALVRIMPEPDGEAG
jgi:photoactive yellow protein